MTIFLRKTTYLGLLIILIISCKGSKQNNRTQQIFVKINLQKTKKDQVPVKIISGSFKQDTVLFRLPKVVQGTYAISDFGRFIDKFEAFSKNDKAINVTHPDTNTWSINNAKDLAYITYLVNDTFDQEEKGGIGKDIPFSPSGTNIEKGKNFVLNLHGFVGYFEGFQETAYTIEVTSDNKQQSTAALPLEKSYTTNNEKDKIDIYHASRYFEVTDNPMFYGNINQESFMVGNIQCVLSVYSPNKIHSANSLKKTISKMMSAQKKYLGDINATKRYDIYLYLADSNEEKAPKGFGALEHHKSTVVVMPEFMPKETLSKHMIDIVSHEFFHIIAPLSIHSEDVHNFDYYNPSFSKHLWMYEGVTEYFSNLFQINQGLISEEEFYDNITEKIIQSKRYDDQMSFTDMSEQIIKEPYASNYLNVYQKGALIGMCVDILIREESNGERGILNLMKDLSAKYGTEKAFKDDDLIDIIGELSYPSVVSFLRKHVEGNMPIDYNKFFKKVGLGDIPKRIKTGYFLNGGSFILKANPLDQKITFTDEVSKNSFWNEQGVQEDDELISINNVALNAGNAAQILGKSMAWQTGDDLKVTVKRKGRNIKINTQLTQAFTESTSFEVLKEATEQNNKLRNAWLKN